MHLQESILLLLAVVQKTLCRNCTITVSGPDAGKPCSLPFEFQEVRYLECTNVVDQSRKFWCSTKTDSLGVHVDGEGNWGYCDPRCNFGSVNWPKDYDSGPTEEEDHEFTTVSSVEDKEEDLTPKSPSFPSVNSILIRYFLINHYPSLIIIFFRCCGQSEPCIWNLAS